MLLEAIDPVPIDRLQEIQKGPVPTDRLQEIQKGPRAYEFSSNWVELAEEHPVLWLDFHCGPHCDFPTFGFHGPRPNCHGIP